MAAAATLACLWLQSPACWSQPGGFSAEIKPSRRRSTLGHQSAQSESERRDTDTRRRSLLLPALATGLVGCGCAVCRPKSASAMVSLAEPNAEAAQRFDVPRNKAVDAGFAQGMYYGMRDYEAAVAGKKQKLFQKVLPTLPRDDAVVVEIGIGSFPNAPFYRVAGAPATYDIIGIDPNDSMELYARTSAVQANVLSATAEGNGSNLRIKHAVSEALPLADKVADLVVCSLTLCSVLDPVKSVDEIKRVLKPGGKFLFHEHVLSETSDFFAEAQRMATPSQMKRADGCRLDRRTGEIIKQAGFGAVDSEYYELKDFFYLNPTVSGIATV